MFTIKRRIFLSVRSPTWVARNEQRLPAAFRGISLWRFCARSAWTPEVERNNMWAPCHSQFEFAFLVAILLGAKKPKVQDQFLYLLATLLVYPNLHWEIWLPSILDHSACIWFRDKSRVAQTAVYLLSPKTSAAAWPDFHFPWRPKTGNNAELGPSLRIWPVHWNVLHYATPTSCEFTVPYVTILACHPNRSWKMQAVRKMTSMEKCTLSFRNSCIARCKSTTQYINVYIEHSGWNVSHYYWAHHRLVSFGMFQRLRFQRLLWSSSFFWSPGRL